MHADNLILLVEDLPEDQIAFKHALQNSGLDNPLRIVNDGHQAVDYLRGNGQFADRQRFPLPKIVLLGLALPGMDGWELLRWVRSDAHYSELLVVVFTGVLHASDLKRVYEMGGNSFLL